MWASCWVAALLLTALSILHGAEGACADNSFEALQTAGLAVSSCADLAESGYCGLLTREAVEGLCALSCGLCRTEEEESPLDPCADVNASVIDQHPRLRYLGATCSDIALAGGCASHADAANVYCPASCAVQDCPNACHDNDELFSQSLVLPGDDCATAALQDACSDFSGIMRAVCPVSCGMGCAAFGDEDNTTSDAIVCVCDGEFVDTDDQGRPLEPDTCLDGIAALTNADLLDPNAVNESNVPTQPDTEDASAAAEPTSPLEAFDLSSSVFTTIMMVYTMHQRVRLHNSSASSGGDPNRGLRKLCPYCLVSDRYPAIEGKTRVHPSGIVETRMRSIAASTGAAGGAPLTKAIATMATAANLGAGAAFLKRQFNGEKTIPALDTLKSIAGERGIPGIDDIDKIKSLVGEKGLDQLLKSKEGGIAKLQEAFAGNDQIAKLQEALAGNDQLAKLQEALAGGDQISKLQETLAGNDKIAKLQEALAGNDKIAKLQEALTGNDKIAKHQEALAGNDQIAKLQEAFAGGDQITKLQEAFAGEDQIAKLQEAFAGGDQLAKLQEAFAGGKGLANALGDGKELAKLQALAGDDRIAKLQHALAGNDRLSNLQALVEDGKPSNLQDLGHLANIKESLAGTYELEKLQALAKTVDFSELARLRGSGLSDLEDYARQASAVLENPSSLGNQQIAAASRALPALATHEGLSAVSNLEKHAAEEKDHLLAMAGSTMSDVDKLRTLAAQGGLSHLEKAQVLGLACRGFESDSESSEESSSSDASGL